MSASKTIFTFIAGIASGLALVYYTDPKGSQKKLKQVEKEIKKTRKILDKKLTDYKMNYNGIIDKYSEKSKEFIDTAKEIVDGAKNSVKAN